MKSIFTVFSVGLLFCATSALAATLQGNWGGAGAYLAVGASSVQITLNCASATMQGPVVLDDQGNFSAEGTYTRLSGSAIGQVESQPAAFSGQVQGNALELTIQIGADAYAGTYHLQQGQNPTLDVCP